MGEQSIEIRRLSRKVEVGIAQRLALRDQHLLQAEALQQSIERLIEMDTGVNLQTEDWILNMEEGQIEHTHVE